MPIVSVAEKIYMRFITLSFFLFSSFFLFAQQTIIKGKITDANSGDPIPFVNVVFKGTGIGSTTDFDGNYTIKTSTPTDSLSASYIGYKPKHKKVVKGISQTIDFQIEEDIQQLDEVVIKSGVNPAFEILKRVNKNKKNNDKRKLTAYEYDTYTKIEIDVDNISEKFRGKKIMKKIANVLDSIDRIAGEDGKPILPLLITESVSKLYYRDDPSLKFENILQSKITGVGVEDGTLVTQLVGSSFQEYNFYQNWLNIVSKEFISPIADGGRLYYDYDLMDSLYVGNEYCYRLDFYPKSPQDLAFTGTMWISKDGYALKQIDATIGKQANLNFVEKIKIQQELERTEEGAWLPSKNRLLIDISEVNNGQAGMLAKFYTSNKKFVVNKPYEPSFYSQPIVMAEDARLNESETYWDTLRHEPLSSTEKNVYKMIDTLQTIPVIRTYTDIIKIVIGGYLTAGKIDIGPYVSLLAINNIEGVRIQPGFKTNMKFSNMWVIGGQVGYGFKDDRVKYLGYVQSILSRKRWTTLTFKARSDLGRVGLEDENIGDNFLLQASQRFGTFRSGYYFNEGRVDFKREFFKGFSQRVGFRYFTFSPTYDFAYYNNPEDLSTSDTLQNFQTSELIFESRYARDELFVQDDNDRISLGTTRWPVITFRYVKGISGVIDSDFDYEKFRLSLSKRLRMGPLGVGYLNLSGDYVKGTLPYPLLTLHIGNQTIIYSTAVYNLMRYGEFVSDKSVALQYQHHFEGLFLNRIPLMRKLKWRLTGSANVVYGSLSQANLNLNADVTPAPEKHETLEIGTFQSNKPYVELGYGVENIFKFLRVEFVHRMTYTNNLMDGEKPKNFGVRIGFQFTL